MSSNNKKTKGHKEQIVLSEQDKVLHDLIVAPSKEIDAITSNLVIRDTEYIIEYLKQRINLEQKYLDDLGKITDNIQRYCIPNEHNKIQMAFMSYVGLNKETKPFKLDYIEKLKEQCDELVQFRNEQQKLCDKNKSWMNHQNNEYIMARLKKLPTAIESYNQKWDEIEKSSGTSISTPMAMSPMTANDMMDKNNRIERFMKKHLNKPEDVAKQNIKLAKLKVEVAEADANYRNVVREINTLAIKTDSTNHYILNNVQIALKEKSDKVQYMLQTVLKAEIDQLEFRQAPNYNLINLISKIDNEHEAKVFNRSSSAALRRFQKPASIYYNNYHVGLCKDLIFGTSLTEYAQQKNRSPPLLITKCIEAIERLGGLEKEGIYRVPGKQSNLDKIKHAFEIDEEAVVIGQNDVPEDVLSIASIIKIFLRELNSPLFPFKLTDRLVYSQIPDQELRLMNLLTRLLKLPAANYDTLKALIHHLTKLQECVEKNKMTINNLTLIFTPAIFQDLNHAQNSPGEWAKDCVLEDLILNFHDIFANKDLHNNSAITGDIQYGFNQVSEQDSDNHHNRYAMTIQSPDSLNHDVTENEYTFVTEEQVSEGEETVVNSVFSEPPRSASPVELEQHQTSFAYKPTSSDQRKKYQNHFQGKGLKVDTGSISISQSTSTSTSNSKKYYITPTVKSATVPSYDWLNMDPDNNPVPEVPKLKRSATTGKKVLSRRKMTGRGQEENVPVPDLPRKMMNLETN